MLTFSDPCKKWKSTNGSLEEGRAFEEVRAGEEGKEGVEAPERQGVGSPLLNRLCLSPILIIHRHWMGWGQRSVRLEFWQKHCGPLMGGQRLCSLGVHGDDGDRYLSQPRNQPGTGSLASTLLIM